MNIDINMIIIMNINIIIIIEYNLYTKMFFSKKKAINKRVHIDYYSKLSYKNTLIENTRLFFPRETFLKRFKVYLVARSVRRGQHELRRNFRSDCLLLLTRSGFLQ